MLEIISDFWKRICLTFALGAGALLLCSSCASQPKQTALVSDPDTRVNSDLPWNTPASWEGRGDLPPGLGEQQESPHAAGVGH